MTLYKFYGPPGTGKTHRLISRVKAYARTGVPLHKIGYFAFTRKAAREARDRYLDVNTHLNKKDIKHFQVVNIKDFFLLIFTYQNINC